MAGKIAGISLALDSGSGIMRYCSHGAAASANPIPAESGIARRGSFALDTASLCGIILGATRGVATLFDKWNVLQVRGCVNTTSRRNLVFDEFNPVTEDQSSR